MPAVPAKKKKAPSTQDPPEKTGSASTADPLSDPLRDALDPADRKLKLKLGETTGADGSSTSRKVTLKDDSAKLSRTRTRADGTSQSTDLSVSKDGTVGFGRENDSGDGIGLELSEDAFKLEAQRKKKGGSAEISDKGLSLGVKSGDNELSGGFSVDKGTVSVNAKGKLGKIGGGGSITIGNGTYGADIEASAGLISAGLGGHVRDQETSGWGESMIGRTHQSGNASERAAHGSAGFIVHGGGSSRSAEQVQVYQQQGNPNLGERLRLRDQLVAGQPVDPASLSTGTGFAISQERESSASFGVDALVYDGGSGDRDLSQQQRDVARTEDGIRLRETRSDAHTDITNSGILLDIVRSDDEALTGSHTEVIDYLIDPEDAHAMGYAADFAQTGLLPSWDVLAEPEDAEEMQAALEEVRRTQDPERWQAFRARYQGLIDRINARVREDVRQDSPTQANGVRLTGHSQQDHSLTEEASNTLIFFGGEERRSSEVSTHRTEASDGSMVTERRWGGTDNKGRTRSVTVSGDMKADSAIRVEDSGLLSYQQSNIDLSPRVLHTLGETLNKSNNADALWADMRQRVSGYWQQRLLRLSDAPADAAPEDDSFLWAKLPAAQIPAALEAFSAVDGPDAFAKLSPQQQIVFVETAAYAHGKATQDRKHRGDGAASGFDAAAAIVTIEDPAVRRLAIETMAVQVTADGRRTRSELEATAKKADNAGVEWMASEAGRGQQADPDLVFNDAQTWASNLDGMVQAGNGNRLMAYLDAMKKQGGTPFIDEVFTHSTNRPLQVAQALAESSTSNPERFVSAVMEGSPHQASLKGWWEPLQPTLIGREGARISEAMYEESKARSEPDPSSGLGQLGLDKELLRAELETTGPIVGYADPKAEALRQESIAKMAEADGAFRQYQIEAIHAALSARDPKQVAQSMQMYRKRFGPKELSDFLTYNVELKTLRQVFYDDESGAMAEALDGTKIALDL